jgi:hypothetical protein
MIGFGLSGIVVIAALVLMVVIGLAIAFILYSQKSRPRE